MMVISSSHLETFMHCSLQRTSVDVCRTSNLSAEHPKLGLGQSKWIAQWGRIRIVPYVGNSNGYELTVAQAGIPLACGTILRRASNKMCKTGCVRVAREATEIQVVSQHTMRFGSTAKVLAECKHKYYRISECSMAGPLA